VTNWDFRAFTRALSATFVALLVVWLVTAASDEGQLTVGARAGRTLPLAPLCSAVAAALALGTSRVRGEAHALEALGRSPSENAFAAALGASLPSVLLGLVIATSAQVDVSPFYPRPPRAEVFVREDAAHAFASPTLGIAIHDEDGAMTRIRTEARPPDEGLPRGARMSAALATAVAGIALSLLASRSVLRPSLLDVAARRRRKSAAAAGGILCALATLVAFQAAAARAAPAALAVVPSLLLLVVMLIGYLARHEQHAR
jgi:hypothetical protein